MTVRTFLAMIWAREGSALCELDLLDLVVADLNRRLAPEDRDQHLEFGGVLVDLGDLAGEVGEWARDDFDRFADRELGLGAGPLGGLAVKQAVDLRFGERHRLVALGADEAGHPGGVF